VSADVTYLAEFSPPGPNDFEFPSLFGNQTGELGQLLTKSSFLLVLAAVVVAAYFLISTRKLQLVPGRGQFVLESSYNFVRDSIGRDIIGTRDFLRWVPLLVSLFFFILVNNIFGMFPILQFPSFSRVGFAYGLAILIWVIYNTIGIRKHGFFGYLKFITVPPGVTGPVLLLVVPLEFLSTVIVRPVTLSLRLFANMFAGHLLIILFATGAEYLLIDASGIVNHVAGVLSFVLGVAVGFLELLVEFLQAFVFTLLTATYIGGALAEEH
jgi:F-type H+-transporting ATPase subunit a